jgi:putative nucleotidyltransferase with HDIG domain
MDNDQNHFIDVSQLRVGLFVHLDLGWMDHPFTLSNFKIKDKEQIDEIRKTGLKKLRYNPLKSDCDPLPFTKPISFANPSADAAEQVTAAIKAGASQAEAESEAAKTLQDHQAERLRQLHRALDEGEKKFIIAGNIVRQSLRNIVSQPQESIQQAELLVSEMVCCILNESDIAIHAVNGNRSNDTHYLHSLNVTVLALMIAKSLGISRADAQELGMAALLHDIGKMEIPDKILMKKDPLTKSEQSYYEQHSEIGARMTKAWGMSDHITQIIMHHHECADGTGYPNHLKTEQTDLLVRLVALVNGYDNLCNPQNIAIAKTPYEALAHMFANQRSKFDDELLKKMIKLLGIYPPGSIVQLSNGIHAIVISVNPNQPLRPYVMLHDPLTDRQEPLILDLRKEATINISICMRPNQLPADALDYLNPRKRISYFIDADVASD